MRLLLILLYCFFTVAETKSQFSGQVLSADTKIPVAFANVYINNTMIGTVTNEKGMFSIDHIPELKFDLIISCIGYETQKLSLEKNKIPSPLIILFKPKFNELQEVIVEPYEKDGWEKWGQTFTDNFIGTASFAQDCKLINRDAVHFRFEKKRNTIIATANEPLIIENNALGYILKYDLSKFEFNPDTNEFFFQGFPFFEEMKTDRRGLAKRWMENRQLAYYGSIMHFMRSLFRNTLVLEKFEVKNIVSVSKEERKRVESLYKTLSKQPPVLKKTVMYGIGKEFSVTDSTAIKYLDSMIYYESVVKQPDKNIVLINSLLNGDKLAYTIDSFAIGFHFQGKIQIAYIPRRNPTEYQRYLPKNAYFSPVSSVIYLINDKPVVVLANGSYFEGSELMIQGYWAWWEKMCTKLPYEYWPPPISKK